MLLEGLDMCVCVSSSTFFNEVQCFQTMMVQTSQINSCYCELTLVTFIKNLMFFEKDSIDKMS